MEPTPRRSFRPAILLAIMLCSLGTACGVLGSSEPEFSPPPRVRGPRPALIERIETTDRVVFVTIDDGWWQDERIFDWLLEHPTPMTMYLTDQAADEEATAYYRRLVEAGAMLENHTLTHPDLALIGTDLISSEICDTQDRFLERYGVRPTSFRPPYGSYDDRIFEAARMCDLETVVMWNAEIKEGALTINEGRPALAPGDIILFHFRPELVDDLEVLLAELERLDLRVARLEHYLPGGARAAPRRS